MEEVGPSVSPRKLQRIGGVFLLQASTRPFQDVLNPHLTSPRLQKLTIFVVIFMNVSLTIIPCFFYDDCGSGVQHQVLALVLVVMVMMMMTEMMLVMGMTGMVGSTRWDSVLRCCRGERQD